MQWYETRISEQSYSGLGTFILEPHVRHVAGLHLAVSWTKPSHTDKPSGIIIHHQSPLTCSPNGGESLAATFNR